MASLFPYLARALVPALSGALQGRQQGQEDARVRGEQSQAALMRRWAFERQQAEAAQADQDRERTQALANATNALSGVHLGTAPTTAEIPVDGPGGAVRLPSRYEQVGGAYIDRPETPRAHAAQDFERQQAAAQAAADRAERVREFRTRQAEAANAERDRKRHAYRLDEIAATPHPTRADPAATASDHLERERRQFLARRIAQLKTTRVGPDGVPIAGTGLPHADAVRRAQEEWDAVNPPDASSPDASGGHETSDARTALEQEQAQVREALASPGLTAADRAKILKLYNERTSAINAQHGIH